MPPARIRIPKQLEAGFVKILTLENTSFLELSSALEEMPSAYRPDVVASQLLARTKTISADDINEMVSTLLSLFMLRESFDLPDAEFVEQITLAMEATSHRDLLRQNENRSRFKIRLTSLLASVFLLTVSKVLSLTTEHERVFQDARIVTDIRAAFLSKPEEQPKAAVLNHMLRIAYAEGGEIKAFFVALDSDDLAKLIAVLERAEKKTKTLEATLEAANMSYLSVK